MSNYDMWLLVIRFDYIVQEAPWLSLSESIICTVQYKARGVKIEIVVLNRNTVLAA